MASLYESGCKRLVDLALSLLLLLLLAPFLSLIAGILLCTEGRPVFFCQKRPGRGEKPFLIIKFRTMRPAPPGAPEALPDAGRVTPLGAFLRRTSIDELPELWNVLRGDMSLVGPRPLLMRYLPYFRPAERVRFRFRPGITGLAQVQGRNNAAWDQRLAADIQYAETFGFLQDVRILAKTFIQVVLGRDVQVAPSTAMLDLDQERAVMQPAKDASREQGGGARVPARSQATESPGFHVVDAVASDAAAIVQLIQGGFEPRLLAGLVYGYPGIRFFVADQIGLGALSPYRYKVIRGPDGLLAAAEFRILEDALFLNYVAVVPDHFRKGLAMAVIADMR